MKIVTSGLNYLDIDAYGGCIAYAELLKLQGEDAVAFSSATINESVTKTVLSWKVEFANNYAKNIDDSFILIDVSEPDYLEKYVDIDRVEEVIDHHVGFEEFWKVRLSEGKANIEFIGAACTQVYEKWVSANLLSDMSETSARLLISGILDNTLNFKAGVTTQRDLDAYESLLQLAYLPPDWTARYFTECQESIFDDVQVALKNDTKMMQFKNLNADSIAFGQLVIWDAKKATNEYRSKIEQAMEAISDNWFINVVSINEGKSYFICSNDIVGEWATKILDVHFSDGLAEANRLWLRKEVFKQDHSHTL